MANAMKDQFTAQKLAQQYVDSEEYTFARGVTAIATALAAARAEGWKAGVEAAADEVADCPLTMWPVSIAERLRRRALAGPGEREGTR